MTDQTTNPYEARARTRKVRAICKALRSEAGGRFSADQLATIAANMTAAERQVIADVAGTHAPSDRTWAAVVKALRNTYRS